MFPGWFLDWSSVDYGKAMGMCYNQRDDINKKEAIIPVFHLHLGFVKCYHINILCCVMSAKHSFGFAIPLSYMCFQGVCLGHNANSNGTRTGFDLDALTVVTDLPILFYLMQ